jgi:hypothetical protein
MPTVDAALRVVEAARAARRDSLVSAATDSYVGGLSVCLVVGARRTFVVVVVVD